MVTLSCLPQLTWPVHTEPLLVVAGPGDHHQYNQYGPGCTGENGVAGILIFMCVATFEVYPVVFFEAL